MNLHRVFISLTLMQAVVLALLLLLGKGRVMDLAGQQLPALKTAVITLQLTDLSL